MQITHAQADYQHRLPRQIAHTDYPCKLQMKKALKNPSHSQCSPDAAMAISWLGRRNGGFSEAP
jgi:hypothetical protein